MRHFLKVISSVFSKKILFFSFLSFSPLFSSCSGLTPRWHIYAMAEPENSTIEVKRPAEPAEPADRPAENAENKKKYQCKNGKVERKKRTRRRKTNGKTRLSDFAVFRAKKRAAWLPDFALFAELRKRKNANVYVPAEVSKNAKTYRNPSRKNFFRSPVRSSELLHSACFLISCF